MRNYGTPFVTKFDLYNRSVSLLFKSGFALIIRSEISYEPSPSYIRPRIISLLYKSDFVSILYTTECSLLYKSDFKHRL